MRNLLIIFLIVLLFACQRENKLSINCNDITDYNSVLFLVESANVEVLKDSARLKLFLSSEEMKTAFDSMTNPNTDPAKYRKLEYKDYGTILKTDYYEADLLLQIDNFSKGGRNYFFKLRTYDKNRNLLDNFEFATWSNSLNRFCSSTLDNNNIIERNCDKGHDKTRFEITEQGKFILTSLK